MILETFAECRAEQQSDVVIVGAGIAGLYCAYRLIEQKKSRSVTLVERLNRTGGRLDTDIIRVKPHQVVREEEGGMRFNFGMTELMQLVYAMGLCDQIVPFPMSSDDNTNRFNVRGRSFTVHEANASGNMIWSELYDLLPQEVGLSPTELVTNAYRNILSVNGAKYKGGRSPEFWQKFREKFTWNGKTMNEWLLWGLLRDMGYSEECIQMLSETIGFAGPFKSLANAGDALQILADFPKDPVYYTFRKGFSTLPNAVVEWLEQYGGDKVKILLSTNVDSIVKHGKAGYELRMTEAPEGFNSNPFIPGGETRVLRTERLILACAARGLEKLFIMSPALNEGEDAQELWVNIHASLGMKLMKINLYFDKPWWLDGQTSRPPVQFGPNFSSLPVNAVYPFYSLRREGSDNPLPRANAAAALTIYCDFDNTNFWRGLQEVGPMFSSELQETQNDKVPQTLFPASVAVVEEARRQLGLLFSVNWVPEPILTSYRLWNGEDDFEFAYHQWRQGVKDSDVMEYLAAPRDNLHVCNEAFSDMQGWVNGSIRSADRVLAHFGIKPQDGKACSDPAKTGDAEPTLSPLRHRYGLWGG